MQSPHSSAEAAPLDEGSTNTRTPSRDDWNCTDTLSVPWNNEPPCGNKSQAPLWNNDEHPSNHRETLTVVWDSEPPIRSDNPNGSLTRWSNSDQERRRAPDGGWGWVIVLCSLTISLVQDGVSFSFGLIYVELLREFGESMSKTSWVGALFLAVPLLAGPLASALVERFGCRNMTMAGGIISALGFVASAVLGSSIEALLVTYGLISGFGLAIGYVTAVVSVAYWFDKRLSLANGIGVSGTGIGTFVLAPLTQLCISEYGWRGTSLLLAGAFLQICVCGAAMRDPEWRRTRKTVLLEPPAEPDSYLQHTHHRPSLTYRGALVQLGPAARRSARQRWWRRLVAWLDLALFCEPAFLLLGLSTLLLYTWVIVPYLYLAEHMLRHGYSETDTSLVIAIIGIPSTVAMVVLGWAGDKPWMPVAKTYAACLVLSGVATLAMPLVVHSFTSLATAAALFGLSLASNYSFTPVLVLQIVQLERFTSAYGLVLLVQGIGNLLGPPLAGMVFDLTGTWDLSFYLAGVFLVIAGLLALLISLWRPPRLYL